MCLHWNSSTCDGHASAESILNSKVADWQLKAGSTLHVPASIAALHGN